MQIKVTVYSIQGLSVEKYSSPSVTDRSSYGNVYHFLNEKKMFQNIHLYKKWLVVTCKSFLKKNTHQSFHHKSLQLRYVSSFLSFHKACGDELKFFHMPLKQHFTTFKPPYF